MSGGSWDYVYTRFNDVSDRLLREPSLKRKTLGRLVKKVSEAMYAIEWVDSSDMSPGDEIRAINAVLKFNYSKELKEVLLYELDEMRKEIEAIK